MTIGKLFAMVVASIAMVGCSTSMVVAPEARAAEAKTSFNVRAASKKPKACAGSACEIAVYTSCDATLCIASVSDDLLVLKGPRNSRQQIIWTLDGSVPRSIVFADPGITIEDQLADDRFTCQPVADSNGAKFSCTTDRRKFGAFKYTVRLRNTAPSGPPIADLDPYVVTE